jgi:hypothetical protein
MLVREGRVELPRPFGHRILSPARLPFRHSRVPTLTQVVAHSSGKVPPPSLQPGTYVILRVRRRNRSRSLGAVKSVFANFELRRVELAYVLFSIARWRMRVAILVFAYERGGVEEASLVAVIIEVPAAIVAPMASVIGDEVRRDRALLAG